VAVPAAVFMCSLVLVAGVLGGEGPGGGGAAAAGFNGEAVPAAYRDLVATAGRSCPPVLSPAILAAQLEQESGWDPRALSPVGAMGIAQFMPGTWPSWGEDENGDGRADPWDPVDAIPAAARYDCAIARAVQGYIDSGRASGDVTDLMLAGYNAGPGRVAQFGGIPPYPETEGYVKTIRALSKKFEALNAPAAGGGSFGDAVVNAAVRWLGTPYSWGGGTATGPSVGFGPGAGINGFDCSGLVIYAIAQASGGELLLSHSSQEQATKGARVEPGAMLPGDVIAFDYGGIGGGYSHIGIYIGGGSMVHAPATGDVVKISDLSDPSYASVGWAVRRFG